MAYQKDTKSLPVRQLRNKPTRKALEFSEAHHAMFAALLSAADQEDIGVYLGPKSTTGGKKIKFYLGDEIVEDYVSCTDDPVELGAYIADQVFGAQIANQVKRIVLAATPQEAPGGAEGGSQVSKVKKLRSEAPEAS